MEPDELDAFIGKLGKQCMYCIKYNPYLAELIDKMLA
jgi:hypothetical protein